VSRLAVALEEARFLPPNGSATAPVGGVASVVALGVEVTVHADEAAFAASDASIMGDPGGDFGEPPAEVVANGWPWPPRMSPDSFFPYGMFGDPAEAQPYAVLNGVVLDVGRRTVELTGRSFVVARVRTVDVEVDVCLPDSPQPPAPGNVVGGTVYLAASLPGLPPPR
jgi:hypothetical protein